MKPLPICATALAVGLLVVGSLFQGCSRPSNEFKEPPPPTVTVATPLVREVTTYIEFNGYTAAVNSVDIYARVSGYLQEIHFEDGASVKQGDPLFTIDPAPYNAALAAAEADVASRQAEAELAKTKLDSVTRAHQQDAATDFELAQAQAEYALTQAQTERAQAAVKDAQLNVEWTIVKSPITGRASRSNIDRGNLIGDGQRTLLTNIVQRNPMHVYFNVNERDALELKGRPDLEDIPREQRKPVLMTLVDGTAYPHAGVPDYVSNRVDSDTGMFEVRAEFPNEEGWLAPGMFVRLKLPKFQREEMLVPEVALQRDLVGSFLLLVGKDKKVERCDVDLGRRVGELRVITPKGQVQSAAAEAMESPERKRAREEGDTGQGLATSRQLQPDDQVIVLGLQRARVGMPVLVEAMDLAERYPTAEEGAESEGDDAEPGRESPEAEAPDVDREPTEAAEENG